MAPDDSPLLQLSHGNVAKALANEALQGGPDEFDEDDVLHALWAGTKPWMLGRCGVFAEYLRRSTGKPVFALECRANAKDEWDIRHAGVLVGDPDEALRKIARGDGMDVPMIDALGHGTFDQRLDLYHNGVDAFRVMLIGDYKPIWAAQYEAMPDPVLEFNPIDHLPGLALSFDHEFDVQKAVAGILSTYSDNELRRVQDLEGLKQWAYCAPALAI